MFIDEVAFHIKAGDGGSGVVTFRTEKHVPRGGPNGGDGGRGGSVVFETDSNLSTLLDFRPGKHYSATRGGDGMSNHQYGKDGPDLVLKVPPGTQIFDAKTGELIADLDHHPQRAVLAPGGRGGRGNSHFTSSVQQAPKFAEKGEPGEERDIRLELKLLADVGLLGFPNVGKSTLLSVVSAARPKIADYPFTTLVPNLGVAQVDGVSFVLADIPGLIERASEGAGLGIQFLKHLERTRLLIHLIDVSGYSGREPLDDYQVINRELAAFSEHLANLPQVIVFSRIDLVADRSEIDPLISHFMEQGQSVFPISAATGEGMETLLYHIRQRLEELPRAAVVPDGPVRITVSDKRETDPRTVEIERGEDGVLVVRGKALERIVAMTDLNNAIAVRRLQRQLSRWGIFRKLQAAGAAEGDTVRIRGIEFDYVDDETPPG